VKAQAQHDHIAQALAPAYARFVEKFRPQRQHRAHALYLCAAIDELSSRHCPAEAGRERS
jgi:hypothetical protein